ncbi:MAG: hypothetical protein ISS26_03500 [Candidatus Omnitrophica bacterium]|nr:hypothetical protein [Candidatus Omnitrophota bacterium]
MKKNSRIFGAIVILISIVFFQISCSPTRSTHPKIDHEDWDITYLKQYIFPHIDVSQINNYHSVLNDPPPGRRAVRDMIFVFEIPADNLNSVLDERPRFEHWPKLSIQEVDHIPSDVVTQTKKYLNLISQHKTDFSFSDFSKEARYFIKDIKSSEPHRNYIIVDQVNAKQDGLLIVSVQLWL